MWHSPVFCDASIRKTLPQKFVNLLLFLCQQFYHRYEISRNLHMLSICETDTVNFYYFSFAAKPRRSLSHFYLRRGTSTQIYKSILSFLSSFLWKGSKKHLGARKALEDGLLKPLSSNLRLGVTSEVIRRSPQPQRPPIWMLGQTCIRISG